MKKPWKNMLLSLSVSAGLLASSVPAFAAGPPAGYAQTTVKVNGQAIEYAFGEAIVRKGVTYVPVRLTLDALGTKMKDIHNGTVRVIVDGKTVTLDTEAELIGGVSFIPVRALAEVSGYEVRWDRKTNTVLLVSEATGEAARGFLWEVKNGPTTVYLVGSMHIADDSFYPLRKEFEEAFAEADYLGVEIDVSKAADEKQQQMILSMGTYQDGTTLKDHISADTYKQLGALLKKNGLQPNAFDKFKPWVVETTISSLQSSGAGYDASAGIDLYFIQEALKRKVPVLELESYESQLGMFNGLSDGLQERNLKAAIDNFDTIADSTDEMADMWKSGDEKALLEMTNSLAEDPEYYKALLTDRNVGMADKIDGYLKSGKAEEYFIVVGAAHYPGNEGILKLLKDKGYTVTRK
ncbi:TraB/GumN family protein [Saccharibacillus alkalitolerans]|uniref:Polysaccharide biosynthesis protein GumN n=1 Tax=Saccharibacillus alkalitolerans TaxID=2705290 RepID=A0ABX0FAK0_9BACL|nr:TraB/GumN family protein [Saccharibacillus alkalitolerans]NGZ77435.1 polysaccharide biosynthesis protein GumN [Saccharibacillus alkalitolerans]